MKADRQTRTGTQRMLVAALLGVVVMGCASTAPRIPIEADAQSMADLAGMWEGEYSSTESGRNGSITFDLSAGADTASGDVTMLTRPYLSRRSTADEPAGTESQPISRTLAITFVQAENDQVRGRLDPYEDPDCGCTLVTVFEGRIRGDQIAGTYTSHSPDNADLIVRGTWSVQRRKQ